jgi:hypothetical protein
MTAETARTAASSETTDGGILTDNRMPEFFFYVPSNIFVNF